MNSKLNSENSSLYNQRRYLANQNRELKQDTLSKDERIKKLESEIAAMEQAKREMQILDSTISNYNKIHLGDLENYQFTISDLTRNVVAVLQNPNTTGVIDSIKARKTEFNEDEQNKYQEKLNNAFDRYKDKIRDVAYSSRGRFQNYYIYQSIEMLTSRVNKLEEYKKQLENVAVDINKIPDDCKYKVSLQNEAQNYIKRWAKYIKQNQMLINKLVELTNGSIDDVN